MLCSDPFINGSVAFPCGRCHACLCRRKKLWTHRIMLETLCHSDNAFVTLTYAPEKEPGNGSLVPADLSSFLKRLRSRVSYPIRFYGVGEYGGQTERPHYHVMLFGYATCLSGRSMYTKRRTDCCSQCDRVRDAWGNGFVGLGSVTVESAGYLCGYITKNMRRTDDPRLNGRWPEFARMSLRPGIGANAMWEVADTMMLHKLDVSEVDVPTSARVGRTLHPYGRYLRRKLREYIGRDPSCPQEAYDKLSEEMHDLRLRARSDEADPSVKSKLAQANAGRLAQIEARSRIFRKKDVL